MIAQQNRLTSAEIGYLWSGYMIDGMATYFLKYFSVKVLDEEIKSVIDASLQAAEKNNQKREVIFKSIDFPIPQAFDDSHVQLANPSPFSDRFFLHYLYNAAKLGLQFHAQVLSTSTLPETRDFAMMCQQTSAQLYNQVVSCMLTKGALVKQPYIPIPEKAEFIQKTSFLNGFFGDQRPLTSMEISNIYSLMELNIMLKVMSMSFASLTKDERLMKIFDQGKSLAVKHIEELSTFLKREDLHIPISYESDLFESNLSPFSDQIMLCHISGLCGSIISNFGFAMGQSMRRDIVALFTKLIRDAGSYVETLTETLIDYEWLEKIPGTKEN